MSDFLTVKAITTNTENILTNTLGFKLEDASSERTPENDFLCQLLLDDIDYETIYGERPTYAEVNFNIKVKKIANTPSDARDVEQEIITLIRGAITTNKLNVGDLAISKLVSRVTHKTPTVSGHANNLSEITYGISIRYREEKP